jgi:hypothetical protein
MNFTLNLAIEGQSSINLYTDSGKQISDGYKRIVLGGRGPYVEFTEDQIKLDIFHVPREQLYRLTDKRIYYVEFRSNDESNVKLYYQMKTVAYADYKIGMFYVSPFDVYLTGKIPVAQSKIQNSVDHDFFS